MSRPQPLTHILRIGAYTIRDHLRQKGFIVMILIGAAFVFFSRSCYQGDYLINGRMLDIGDVAMSVSKMSFHVIAVGMMFLAALLAMRAFRYDRDHGMQACIMAKPITRTQYVTGKVLGLWILALACMFMLHAIVFIVIALRVKVFMPIYLAASLLCAFNLLFMVMSVFVLSLFMTDFIAFIAVMAITLISFVSEGLHTIHQNQLLRVITMPHGAAHQEDVTWTTVMYHLWPKISGLQSSAASLIDRGWTWGWRGLYPLINILAYCLILAALLIWRFKGEEIL